MTRHGYWWWWSRALMAMVAVVMVIDTILLGMAFALGAAMLILLLIAKDVGE